MRHRGEECIVISYISCGSGGDSAEKDGEGGQVDNPLFRAA